MSQFMQPFLYRKGQTYCADCARCGTTHTIHEWITDAFNDERDAMQNGTLRCPECGVGTMDADTFTDCGKQYAGRYSAPGYMDCTDWNFDTNKRRLERTLRDLYGD
jgi:DNA-directed RNA polymerase subunit RPC12/RpoP